MKDYLVTTVGQLGYSDLGKRVAFTDKHGDPVNGFLMYMSFALPDNGVTTAEGVFLAVAAPDGTGQVGYFLTDGTEIQVDL